jgi:predicted permease
VCLGFAVWHLFERIHRGRGQKVARAETVVGRIWPNLIYALRVLRKSPGFTLIAVMSLALGIGANTAIFTLVNALLLRDLPVREPERLVELSSVREGHKMPFSYPMFQEVERGQEVFTELVGWSEAKLAVEMDGLLSENTVLTATGNYYMALGVRPLLGRLLTPEDVNPDDDSTSQVAVVSYEFWQTRLGGTAEAVGREIRIEGQPFTVVGVTQKWFTGIRIGEPPDVTIPITAYPLVQDHIRLDTRSMLWVDATGRLKHGITLEQARGQLQSSWPGVLLATASTEVPGLRRDTFLAMGLDVTPVRTGLNPDLRERFTKPLYVLSAIVGLILVVACVNLANLMLARATARSHEMSVRVAIGASRGSLVAQVLTESVLLSLAGAALGLAFAYWGSRLLVSLMMTEQSVSLDLRPDRFVLSIAVVAGVLMGILFGSVPAWSASRQDPARVLQQGSRSLVSGAGTLSQALIVTQIALSIVLLVGAGLLVSTFERLRSINLGFKKECLLEIELNPTPGGYRNLDMASYRKELLDGIADLPGVRSVSVGPFIPGPYSWKEEVSRPSAEPDTAVVLSSRETILPGFFSTVGIELLQGRDFDETDDEGHPRVVIVNRGLAERLFPDGDAIGKTIRFGFMPEFQNLQIVGIAENARIGDVREAAPSVIYTSGLQFPSDSQWGTLYVRTGGAPEALAKTVSEEIASLGHEYAAQTKTVEQAVSFVLVNERVIALLSGFFAGLGLLLAAIGLYGLMSYSVTGRTREMGIRSALGAPASNLAGTVVRETLALAFAGIAIGVPCALASTRLIASMLYGISPNDLPTIVGVSLLLLVVALIAGYLPARRASQVDPIVALRVE